MSNSKIKNPLRYHAPGAKVKPQFRNIDKTLKLLQSEDEELKTKLIFTNCSTKLAQDREKLVWEIESRLERHNQILDEIKVKKSDIEHLKLGIKEVDSKSFELSITAISEYQYNQNLKRAKRIKENLENRFTILRRNECAIIAENTRLNEMIEKMMIDRKLFSKAWIKLDNQLAANKKFLLAKTDKVAIVFSEADYLRAEMRAIHEKADRFEAMHLAEARNMVRKIVVDENSLNFMAVKLNRRLTGSEANKISTLLTNTRESNTQLTIRKLSMSKELQLIFKKINSILQVLALDDRLDDFNIEKKKEIEYEVNKFMITLDVQLNVSISDYVGIKYFNVKKRKTVEYEPSHENIKPIPVKDVVKPEYETVFPIDMEEMRREKYVPIPSKKETRMLEGISKKPTALKRSGSSSSKKSGFSS